jgi:hypothetical protein
MDEGARDPFPDEADGAPAETEGVVGRLRRELREGRTPQAALAAVLAWSITVAPAAFARGSSGIASALGVLALAAGAGGPIVVAWRERLGRHLGISGFLTAATATWLVASAAIHPARLDPIRGVIGAVAWGVFALSWSDRWAAKGPREEADPDAPALQARAALPAGAVPLAVLGITTCVGYLAIAWRVRDPDRSLLAQAVALSCAVGVLAAAAIVATGRGKRGLGGARRLTPQVLRRLLLLVAFAVAGALVIALR